MIKPSINPTKTSPIAFQELSCTRFIIPLIQLKNFEILTMYFRHFWEKDATSAVIYMQNYDTYHILQQDAAWGLYL